MTAPHVELIDWKTYRYALLDPYTIVWRKPDGTALSLKIPAGFEFDLASVPKALWWRIAPSDLSIVAPLAHDFLYRYQGKPPGHGFALTRAEADQLLRDLAMREGVWPVRAWMAYLAVRAFGWLPWRKWGAAK